MAGNRMEDNMENNISASSLPSTSSERYSQSEMKIKFKNVEISKPIESISIRFNENNRAPSVEKLKKTGVPKTIPSRRLGKTRKTTVKICKRLTPGLFFANQNTKQIMAPNQFNKFLIHVRKRKHPVSVARNFADTVDVVISKIREVLHIFDNGKHCSGSDNAEAKILRDLEERLIKHKECETCNLTHRRR